VHNSVFIFAFIQLKILNFYFRQKLSKELRDADELITQLRREIDGLKDTVDQRDQTIHDLKNRLLILDETKKQRDELMKNLKDFQDSRDQLHKEIEAFRAEFEKLRTQDNEHFTLIHDQKTEVEKILTTREK